MTDPVQLDIYGENGRDDVAPFIPTGACSALDVGCSRGGFGTTLRRVLGPSARIVGVEAVTASAAVARSNGSFDEVYDGYYPGALPESESKFDAIFFNDVLEHIVDPWETLEQCHDRLTPGGHVVAAIPNIQYAPASWGLLRGRWDYTEGGILDRTHVRFFTRRSMMAMFEKSGYNVMRCEPANSISDIWATDPLVPRRVAKVALARLLGDAAYLHFVVVASPTT